MAYSEELNTEILNVISKAQSRVRDNGVANDEAMQKDREDNNPDYLRRITESKELLLFIYAIDNLHNDWTEPEFFEVLHYVDRKYFLTSYPYVPRAQYNTNIILAAESTLYWKTVGTTFLTGQVNISGERVTFGPAAAYAGLNFGSFTADATSPVNGDVSYNSTTEKFRAHQNGAWVDMIGGAAADMAVIGTPTYTTVQHVQDVFHSSGWIGDGAITDAGGGNVDVASGQGLIRATDSRVAQLPFFDWPASAGIAIPTDTTRYIGVEYNAGTPQVIVKTTDTWDYNTDFPIGVVINEGGVLHIDNSQHAVGDHANFMIQRIDEVSGIQRDNSTGGLILGEIGTRNMTVTAGALWDRLNKLPISNIDTSVADTFDIYYRDGAGGFNKTSAATQWDNTSYDNDAGSPTALGANKYGVLWFYIETGGELLGLYGRSEHNTAAGAETQNEPATSPDRIGVLSVLLGRLIFQKSDATATQIDSAFTKVFVGTAVSDHNSLSNLAVGDVHTQYGYLAGRTGGQILIGGIAASEDLTLESTSHGTKGNIVINDISKLLDYQIVTSVTAPGVSGSATLGRIYMDSGDKLLKFVNDTTVYDLTLGGGGDVIKVGTPVDNEIGVWTGDGTIEGDTAFSWDGTKLSILGATSTTTTAITLFQLTANSTGSLGDGFGGSMLWNLEDTAGGNNLAATIAVTYKDSTLGSEDVILTIGTQFNGGAGTTGLVEMGDSRILFFRNVEINDAFSLVFGTTTGTKIGTATSQKIGFWDATPVTQPAHIADASGGATVDTEARAALNALLAQHASTGLQAAS